MRSSMKVGIESIECSQREPFFAVEYDAFEKGRFADKIFSSALSNPCIINHHNTVESRDSIYLATAQHVVVNVIIYENRCQRRVCCMSDT